MAAWPWWTNMVADIYAGFQYLIKGDAFQLHIFLLLVPTLRAVAERWWLWQVCLMLQPFSSLFIYHCINLCASLCICKTLAFATSLIRPESRSALICPILLNILFSGIASQIKLRWLILIFSAVLHVRAETFCSYRGSVSCRMKEHCSSCSRDIYFTSHIIQVNSQ